MHARSLLRILAAGIMILGVPRFAGAQAEPGYLYVWATAGDTAPPRDSTVRPRRSTVMLTIDLRAGSPTRGRVANAVLADTAASAAHHTEHFLEKDGLLFANDFGAGKTHRFDLRSPGAPVLLGSFTAAGPLAYPHSFVRLPNGNVLATFQRRTSGGRTAAPGGLAELRRDGSLVRWSGAGTKGVDSSAMLPYSLEPLPALDRVVTTSTSMTDDLGVHVQVWRLSTLELLHTLEIPRAPGSAVPHGHAAPATTGANAPADAHHMLPGEPRVLADGRTVLFGTFTCGMYRLTGIASPTPKLDFVRAFPGQDCAVPLRIGRFWVQTVPADRALVTLDVSNPAQPREVARLVFADGVTPHWLSATTSGQHLVMTSGTPRDSRIHFVSFNVATGALALDSATPAVDLSRVDVPGLGIVRVVPHGSVFGPAAPR